MQLSLAFVVLRLAYGVIYLMNIAALRSLVWFGAMACSVAICWPRSVPFRATETPKKRSPQR